MSKEQQQREINACEDFSCFLSSPNSKILKTYI